MLVVAAVAGFVGAIERDRFAVRVVMAQLLKPLPRELHGLPSWGDMPVVPPSNCLPVGVLTTGFKLYEVAINHKPDHLHLAEY